MIMYCDLLQWYVYNVGYEVLIFYNIRSGFSTPDLPVQAEPVTCYMSIRNH